MIEQEIPVCEHEFVLGLGEYDLCTKCTTLRHRHRWMMAVLARLIEDNAPDEEGEP